MAKLSAEELLRRTENMLPVKTFVIEEKWREAVLVHAVDDGGEPCSGIHLTFPPDTSASKMTLKQFAALAWQGGLLSGYRGVSSAGPDPFQIGLIDVVTYPVWYCLVNCISVDERNFAATMLQANHRILAPYLHGLGEFLSMVTIPHSNEHPIDDAPTHNLITCSYPSLATALLQARQCGEEAAPRMAERMVAEELSRFIATAPNPIGIRGKLPVMDDRYVYTERLPDDAPPPVLRPLTLKSFLAPSKIAGHRAVDPSFSISAPAVITTYRKSRK